jgi:hypothetical protein
MFFRNRKLMILGSLEPVKPRIRECVKFGNLDVVKRWGREDAEARNHELVVARTSEDGRFGNLSGSVRESGTETRTNLRRKWKPIRESVKSVVRELHEKTFTN